jgi:hypothetical protein
VAQAAWATNQGLPIARAVAEGLGERGVIFPARGPIERIGLAGRSRKRALDAVAGTVTVEQATAIDALLVPEPSRLRPAGDRPH